MAKILLTLLTIFCIYTSPVQRTFAQETVQQETVVQEEESTLADTIQEEEKKISFGAILVATVTPALLVVIAYLMIKEFKL